MEVLWNNPRKNLITPFRSSINNKKLSDETFFDFKEYFYKFMDNIKQKKSLVKGDHCMKNEYINTQLEEWNENYKSIDVIAKEMILIYKDKEIIGNYKYNNFKELNNEEEELLLDFFREE